MLQSYQDWIKLNVEDDPKGQCMEVTEEMEAVFPELTRVRGHYYCTAWGERQHWWLVTASGEVVDPTAAQFPSKGTRVYEPLAEDAPEPTGLCPNCGGFIYGGGQVCSDACGVAFTASLMGDLHV